MPRFRRTPPCHPSYINIDADQAGQNQGATATVQATGEPPPLAPTERFKIIRVEVKGGKRVAGAVKIAVTGKMKTDERYVAATVTTMTGGWVKLTPTEPLTAGEYAVAEMLGKEGMNLYVWDFGVRTPPRPPTLLRGNRNREKRRRKPTSPRICKSENNSRRQLLGGKPPSIGDGGFRGRRPFNVLNAADAESEGHKGASAPDRDSPPLLAKRRAATVQLPRSPRPWFRHEARNKSWCREPRGTRAVLGVEPIHHGVNAGQNLRRGERAMGVHYAVAGRKLLH